MKVQVFGHKRTFVQLLIIWYLVHNTYCKVLLDSNIYCKQDILDHICKIFLLRAFLQEQHHNLHDGGAFLHLKIDIKFMKLSSVH